MKTFIDLISDHPASPSHEMGVEELYTASESSSGPYIFVALHHRRITLLMFVMIALLGIIVLRLGYLQLLRHHAYQLLADDNRIRRTYHLARRGIITDREGTPLVENTPSFVLVATPANLPKTAAERTAIVTELQTVFGIDKGDLQRLADPDIDSVREASLGVFLDYDQAMKFELQRSHWPGIELQVLATRKYRTVPSSLSHIIGYIGAVSPEERSQRPALLPVALSGKSGLERSYDEQLRGIDGATLWEYDSQGIRQRIISQSTPTDGPTVKTTISLPIQERTEDALQRVLRQSGRRHGSAIVLNAKTGEVIAMVSLPSFDANVFTLPNQQSSRAKLLSDPAQPLFFRSIAGQYPSGSTIKPLVAVIGLANGVITASTGVQSVGGIRIGEFFFPDWKTGGHGWTTVVKALAESVNTFFYLVVGGDIRDSAPWRAPALGMDRFVQGLQRFGWSRPTGIDIGGESDGFLPTPQWKLEKTGERWYIGDTYHVAIGQGGILVTPIQLATSTAMIASNNLSVRPWLVQAPGLPAVPVATAAVIDRVKEGMRSAVTTGSARRLVDLPITVYAKTGTAQISGNEPPHSWLTSFATIRNTPYVVSVLVEHGGEGSGHGLTVAKDIYKALYQHAMSLTDP